MYHEIDPLAASEAACSKNDAATELALQTHPIILFLKEEIEQSSELLRQLARIFTVEICAVSESTDLHAVKSSIFRMSEALQSEDRIQQRLWDIGCALGMLEGAINPANNTDCRHLSMSIVRQLKLNEMQVALATKANVNEEIIVAGASSEPSLGEIDLF